MAAARLAAGLLVALSTVLSAESTSKGQVTIAVVDQGGSIIPRARIGVIPLTTVTTKGDWFHYAVNASEQALTYANANGKATVSLPKGSYAVSIEATGFARRFGNYLPQGLKPSSPCGPFRHD